MPHDPGPLTVVKVGGSLVRDGAHYALIETIGELVRAGHELVVVPGGGAFADAVRRACDNSAVSATAAHWMAVLAMDQMAYLLAGRSARINRSGGARPSARTRPLTSSRRSPAGIPARDAPADDSRYRGLRACVVRSAVGIARAFGRSCVPVLAPFRWLLAVDPLPHSWDVTSDSIAAWFAAQLDAPRLILLKSVDGIRDATEALCPVVARTAITAAAGRETDVLDRYFRHGLAASTECWIINGRWPERLRALVETQTTTGTVVR